ncbi:MAG: RNA polymerase sigma factor [Armatimonadota bacterium]
MNADEHINYITDMDLMLRVKAGDVEAFDMLSGRYRGKISGFLYSLCWNLDTAQDCAQEVLLRVWLSRERYQASASFSSYIYKIARNYWLSVLRKKKLRPDTIPLDGICLPDDSADLEKMLIRRYMDRRVRLVISNLPDHLQMVFILSHFQDLKYAEIAEILDIPVGTVKSRMSTAVKILRGKISEEMRDDI